MTVKFLHDSSFEIDGESFIQPEIIPRGICDEIARPTMCELVSNQRCQRSIAGKNGRRCKSESWILHSAERKTRWQNQHIVSLPLVGAIKLLCASNHFFQIFEFPCSFVNCSW